MNAPKALDRTNILVFIFTNILIPILVNVVSDLITGFHMDILMLLLASALVALICLPPLYWTGNLKWSILPIYLVMLASVLTVASAIAVQQRARFDFENGTTEGWDIRVESGNRLGESMRATDAIHYGLPWEAWSLEFQFNLRQSPFDKAQIKVENQKLEEEMSTRLYLGRNSPSDLFVNCFVLEHNSIDPNKPEWPFYQTAAVKLGVGEWTQIKCPANSFSGVNTTAPWNNPPLLIGFQIAKKDKALFNGAIYFDKINVR